MTLLEKDFLRFNLEKHLIYRTINPLLLFSKNGRTESAIKYYQKFLFHDATFADLIQPERPMIIINASDLGYGIRFSFIQEYFDLLCSEPAAYPVADAVAASSAVPVLFNPIYADKDTRKFIHFVDGGITDNLGLRAVTDVMSISADPTRMYQGGTAATKTRSRHFGRCRHGVRQGNG